MACTSVISQVDFGKVEPRFKQAGISRMHAHEAVQGAYGSLLLVEEEISKYRAMLDDLQKKMLFCFRVLINTLKCWSIGLSFL